MIVCNTIILMMKFHGNSEFYEKVRIILFDLLNMKEHSRIYEILQVLRLFNTALTAVFTVESILKILAFGVRVRIKRLIFPNQSSIFRITSKMAGIDSILLP